MNDLEKSALSIKSESGVSIIATLIAVVILVTAAIGITTAYKSNRNSRKQVKAKLASRDIFFASEMEIGSQFKSFLKNAGSSGTKFGSIVKIGESLSFVPADQVDFGTFRKVMAAEKEMSSKSKKDEMESIDGAIKICNSGNSQVALNHNSRSYFRCFNLSGDMSRRAKVTDSGASSLIKAENAFVTYNLVFVDPIDNSSVTWDTWRSGNTNAIVKVHWSINWRHKSRKNKRFKIHRREGSFYILND